jgi:phosphatidylglycerol---prolipoprotein diacylglyceryl transferase
MPGAPPIPLLYPMIMLLAVACGGWLLRRMQGSLPLSKEQRIALGAAAFCGAMLGSKVPFLLADWQGFLRGTAWFSSGKTILCGLVGAYLGVELAKWTLGIRARTGDSFVIPAAITIAIGRLACLSAGCCYGTPTGLPWGLQCALTDDLPRHPTQIYESLFHFGMAGLLFNLQRRGVWKGQLAKFYFLSYFVYRFLTEFIRPEARYSMHLTGYQWLILALIPIFAFLWWRDAGMARMGVEGSVRDSWQS